MSKEFMVIGGELAKVDSTEFRDPDKVERYGPFDADGAKDEWKARSWSTVDNAHMRWFIVPIGE